MALGGGEGQPRPSASRAPTRTWLAAVWVALALLVLPALAWVVIPARSTPTAAAGSALPAVAVDNQEPEVEPDAARRTIAGRVVDDSGAPRPGVSVSIKRGRGSLGSKTSDENGAFSFEISEGAAVLSASLPGVGAASLDVAAAGDVVDLELVLAKASEVSGKVVDGEGNAVVSAHVACEGDHGAGATSDEQGRFKLPSSAVGCSATASHPDHGTSAAVTLRAGTRNVIAMASPGKISGTVLDEKGAPFQLAIVAIESFVPVGGEIDGPFYKQTKVDPEGEFSLSDLAPGRYVLMASAPGRPPTKTRAIELSAGENARGVSITLTKGATLSGTVTDRETGRPIAGARVRLDAVTSSGASANGGAETDAEGKYTLAGVPSGPFSVKFRHNDYKERIVSLDASQSNALTENVDLAKKGDGPDMEMTGIGATLLQGSKFVEVASVLEGGPAKAAGVLAGDRIERIEGRSAETFTVSDCVQRLRGPEGTRVSVTLGRGTTTVDVTITRAKIVR